MRNQPNLGQHLDQRNAIRKLPGQRGLERAAIDRHAQQHARRLDLAPSDGAAGAQRARRRRRPEWPAGCDAMRQAEPPFLRRIPEPPRKIVYEGRQTRAHAASPSQITASPPTDAHIARAAFARSEEHTSELQSLMRISYAVF